MIWKVITAIIIIVMVIKIVVVIKTFNNDMILNSLIIW